MMLRGLIALVTFAFGAAVIASEVPGYSELRAAQDLLQAAGDYLRAAPQDPSGRRDRAIAYVDEALAEVYRALGGPPVSGSRERQQEQRDLRLEQKRQQREQQLEQKQQQRGERLENR
jgi:hypothetical protein